jgi:hypothetical protein
MDMLLASKSAPMIGSLHHARTRENSVRTGGR